MPHQSEIACEHQLRYALLFIFALTLGGCYRPNSPEYRALYSHLKNQPARCEANCSSDYFLIIYVNARHLDYTDNYSFLNTVAKHPSDGTRNRDVGHVWIYLQGIHDGRSVYLCGGHSGERGVYQAKYFDGIMNYIDFGYATPSKDQLKYPRYEPNPVKYLWEAQNDGYFEEGSGMHKPTFAAKIDLSPEQFESIFKYVHNYDFSNYAITGNQCSSFASQVAMLAGVELEGQITIPIRKELYLKGERIRFWEDPMYSQLTISSPDIIERSLMKAVHEGKAERVK
ncbi:MAG TPA: hypothetical protein VGP47_04645 [Parachlamydiaceae bacterium]|nr:hypothetical protein [Parachlamydiaceae bacterium]